jgi:aminoglycoside 6-adenylyltransferase
MVSFEEGNGHLLERIVAWAGGDAEVDCLALAGSRATGRGDEYSDIDIILATGNVERFFNGTEWIGGVGRHLFTFAESEPQSRHLERRVAFEGGLDADFVILDTAVLERSPELFTVAREVCSGGVLLLIDKRGIGEAILALRGETLPFAFPDRAAFDDVVGDLYFHCLWATKKLARGELWVALGCVNGYLKARLLRMLEWYERARRGIGYDTRYAGRSLELWAEPEILARLESCYGGYGATSAEKALRATESLFADLARYVGSRLGYPFPEGERAELLGLIESRLTPP